MQIILGAGLSGLSLAVALVRAGVTEPVVLVDRRTAFGRDRTWCTWAVPGTAFLELADHRWPAWDVTAGGRTARGSCSAHPYVHIRSDAFYAAALDELDRAPNVALRLGERVLEVGDGWARTDAGRLEGQVHDALALGSPAPGALRPADVELWQTFLGWEVRTAAPVFAPGAATLMDFDAVRQRGHGAHFLYVLPFSETHALVEHTSFAADAPAPAERRADLEAWLDGAEHTVVHEERGRLPMTARPVPARRSPRTAAAGIAGGALRASSGYAFARVQAHAAAVAAAVAAGTALPARAGHPRRAVLDRVFLQALDDDPGAFGARMRDLVGAVPGDVFARFMADASSVADEARMMAALPRAAFAAAAVRAALG